MGMRWTAFTGVALFVLTCAASAGAGPQESEAERQAGRVKTWSELRRVEHRYRSFDDGMVAEVYSEFVVHTLATKWNTLGQLQALVSADPAFGQFVLSHIDATADTAELKTVSRRARQPGTRDTRRLRRRIASAAEEALARH